MARKPSLRSGHRAPR